MPVRALRRKHDSGRVRSGAGGLKTMNAREGIKTSLSFIGGLLLVCLLKTMNAREGIKTVYVPRSKRTKQLVKNNECP